MTKRKITGARDISDNVIERILSKDPDAICEYLARHGGAEPINVFREQKTSCPATEHIVDDNEERGSGFDRMEEGLSDLKIPAPKVESGDGFVRTKLYWYPGLHQWKKEDKIRTCYLATCYYYVNEVEVSNAVLRERFGVEEKTNLWYLV